MCAVIILVATLGKFGGTLAAARFTGLSWKTSAALGVLMNTRGLMELVVLNIGLELGVISPTLFAMMVIMALVTTIATTPILQALTAGEYSTARASK
jgi:Kef-type K+ transport system membrane component KefB